MREIKKIDTMLLLLSGEGIAPFLTRSLSRTTSSTYVTIVLHRHPHHRLDRRRTLGEDIDKGPRAVSCS